MSPSETLIRQKGQSAEDRVRCQRRCGRDLGPYIEEEWRMMSSLRMSSMPSSPVHDGLPCWDIRWLQPRFVS